MLRKFATGLIAMPIACLASPTQLAVTPQWAPLQLDDDDLSDKDIAGRGKPDWTHIVWLGPQSKPLPLIWLTHAPFKMAWLERNSVVPLADYRRIQSLRIEGNQGRILPLIGADATGSGTAFRVTQRKGFGRPVTYYLNRANGCRYLFDILSIAGVKWTADGKEPFLRFEDICRIAGRPLP